MSNLLEVNESSFQKEVLDYDGLVLVDFGATWCGPCVRMLPVLEKWAEQNSDKIKVVKVDTDDNPKLSSTYSVRSVPTLIFFKNGKKVESKVGMVSANELTTILTNNL